MDLASAKPITETETTARRATEAFMVGDPSRDWCRNRFSPRYLFIRLSRSANPNFVVSTPVTSINDLVVCLIVFVVSRRLKHGMTNRRPRSTESDCSVWTSTLCSAAETKEKWEKRRLLGNVASAGGIWRKPRKVRTSCDETSFENSLLPPRTNVKCSRDQCF